MLWRCQLLGGLRLVGAGRTVERFRTQKTALLLGYLAYHRDRWHLRTALADLLWGEGHDPDASLRTALSALRKQLEPAGVPTGSVLQSAGARLRLNPEAVQTDVAQFQELLHRAYAMPTSPERVHTLVDALQLYRGELLQGYDAEWLITPRTQLEHAYLRALREVVPALLRTGEVDTARQLAEQAVAIYPLSEIAAKLQIRLYLSLNLPELAEAAFRRFQHELARQVGDYPRFTLESLREARLEVGKVRGTTRPAGTQPPPTRRRAAVPVPLSRFFGREHELSQLSQLLQQGVRLITITGAPGIGKTRLGQELGLRMEATYAGRVYWVALREAHSEAEVQRRFAQAFECEAEGNSEALLELLAHQLGNSPALLITDNWEQVLDAAPFLAQLLQRVPQLQAIALSRHPLELEGERWLPLEPLPVPEMDSPIEVLQRNPAIALFVDRAQAVRPDFALTPQNAPKVVRLCRALEGAPLAIELAAAQLGTHSLQQLLQTVHERLDWLVSRRRDVGYPYRSLQAALESSYALLEPSLQRAFTQLSLLQGEWETPLADALLQVPTAPLLDALVRHSLLKRRWEDDTPLYSMLDAVRLFAQRKYNAPADSLWARLFEYFEQLGQRVREEFNTAAQLEWLTRLRRLYPNLHAALEWGVPAVPRRAARMLIDYGYFLDWEQRWEEARRWCVRLLSVAELPKRLRAQLLSWLGLFLLRQEQYAQAEQHLHESIQLCRAVRDWDELAGAYNMLGLVYIGQGQREAAARAFAQGVAAARHHARPLILAPILHNWAMLRNTEQRYSEALTLAQEARALYEQLQTPLPLANTLNVLGVCYAGLGEYAAAEAHYHQAAAYYQAAGYRDGVVLVYSNLAELMIQQGQLAQADAYLDCAIHAARTGGTSLYAQGMLVLTRAQLEQARGHEAEAHRLLDEFRRLATKTPLLQQVLSGTDAPA